MRTLPGFLKNSLSHFIIRMTLQRKHYSPHFTVDKTEAQRGKGALHRPSRYSLGPRDSLSCHSSSFLPQRPPARKLFFGLGDHPYCPLCSCPYFSVESCDSETLIELLKVTRQALASSPPHTPSYFDFQGLKRE